MNREILSIQCIVPPHMLQHIVEHGDERLRARALRTLVISAHMRGRREILGALALGTPAGEERRTIYDAKHSQDLPGHLVRGEGDPPSNDTAVNEAYDGLGATYDLFQEVFNRNSIDDRGMRLDATVHFDTDYDNAFFDGRQMVFGDGDGVLFTGFTKAIDVIGHELTHGVTQFTAGLEYHDQPGALNESISDVFGSLVKQHFLGQTVDEADWLIGSGILAPGVNGAALRSMKQPGTAYDDPRLGKDPQPGHMRGYVHTQDDNGGVHINSGIPNRAFYLVAQALGGKAWEDAGHIWYTTLPRLQPLSSFQEAANIMFQVAGELFGSGSEQQQAVADAWSEVGVTVAGARPRTRARGRAPAESNGANLQRELEEIKKRVDALSRKLTRAAAPVS
jgi:Zn-dependent metalloprotease